MRTKPCWIGAAFMAVLGGCTGARPTDLAALDGTYSGAARQRVTNPNCDPGARYALDVRNGQVSGVVQRGDGGGTPVAFQAYVEYDGGMFALVRFGGDDVEIRGQFVRQSFQGEIKAGRLCSYTLSMARAP